MVRKIENDHARFRDIVRGRIKQDLRKYISRGELIGRVGKNIVSIPLPQLELPRFRYGRVGTGGVGSGDGEAGTPLSGEPGESGGENAGDQPGEHLLEVDVSLAELARILGEELQLPRIKPRGRRLLESDVERYTGIRRTGPESLRHFKRTFREALKRQIMMGLYDPARPRIIPIREDRRYRSWNLKRVPESNAVLIYCMDVSGSMGDEQKEIVRIEAFWIDTWLRSQYKNIVTRYIVHDATAKEVDQHTFYHLRESGGTKISAAYELVDKIVSRDYSSDEWNVYPFHFSDGDNWGSDDTRRCVDLLRDQVFPRVNLFCYGQVKSPYGSGKFKKALDEHFAGNEMLVTSEIQSREGILDSIREFLRHGK
ncbi:MAG: DUF444 family protein [Planctomycetales bacterium]|nr:DUF444 family protein [Planctomycetales bacterium]